MDCKLSGVTTVSIAVFVWNAQRPKTRLVLLHITGIKIRAIKKARAVHWMAGFAVALQGAGCLNPTLCWDKIQGINEELILLEVGTVLAVAGMSLVPWPAWREVGFEICGLVPGGEQGQTRLFFPLPCSEGSGASVRVHGKGACSCEKRELIKSWEEYTKSHLSCLLTEPAKIRQNFWKRWTEIAVPVFKGRFWETNTENEMMPDESHVWCRFRCN